jgi:hypothetical protein
VGRRGLLNCEILLGRRFGADEGFDVCGGLYAGNVLKLQRNRVETHEEIHFLLVHYNRIAPCGICCCTSMTYSQDVLTLKTDEFVDKVSSQRHSWKTGRRRHVLQISRIRLACCGMPSSPHAGVVLWFGSDALRQAGAQMTPSRGQSTIFLP